MWLLIYKVPSLSPNTTHCKHCIKVIVLHTLRAYISADGTNSFLQKGDKCNNTILCLFDRLTNLIIIPFAYINIYHSL